MKQPYLLFLGDAPDELAAKSARGIVIWRPDVALGQLRLNGCKADLGVPDMGIDEAVEKGAATMIIGVANSGGFLPDSWLDPIEAALAAGLDVASGLHTRLADIDRLSQAAARHRRELHDLRHPRQEFGTGKGDKRPGKRLLTVGTDCSVGKMFASLALEREMQARGIDADFCATGQSGIMIVGDGVSVDAVVADFISGAVEWLAPANDEDHWDVIEGQGSLFHAAFAGVSLGLLHGAQADALVLCHEPTRSHMRGLPHYPLPSLEECIEANLAAGRLTNPDVRFIGVAVNTVALDPDAASRYLAETSQRLGLPCVDPLTTGVGPLVDNLFQSDG